MGLGAPNFVQMGPKTASYQKAHIFLKTQKKLLKSSKKV